MKLLWLTDLHLDRRTKKNHHKLLSRLRGQNADATVITGDISEAHQLPDHLRELGRTLAPRPVYFILGNHDFYGSSFSDVDRTVAAVCREQQNLQHLGQGETVTLGHNSALVGHRGWADGRAGCGSNSRIANPDCARIADLHGTSNHAVFARMAELGRSSAGYFRDVLPYALECYRHVYVVTHAPPFVQGATFNGRRCGRWHLPHYVNKSAGGAIAGIAEHYPVSSLTVLCGHTHSAARATVRSNVEVVVGSPGIAEIFNVT